MAGENLACLLVSKPHLPNRYQSDSESWLSDAGVLRQGSSYARANCGAVGHEEHQVENGVELKAILAWFDYYSLPVW